MTKYFLTLEHDSLTHLKMDVWKMKVRINLEDNDKKLIEIGYSDITVVDSRSVDIFKNASYIGLECISFVELINTKKIENEDFNLITFIEKIYIKPQYRNQNHGTQVIYYIMKILSAIPDNETIVLCPYPIFDEEYEKELNINSSEYGKFKNKLESFYKKNLQLKEYKNTTNLNDILEDVYLVQNLKSEQKQSFILSLMKNQITFSEVFLFAVGIDKDLYLSNNFDFDTNELLTPTGSLPIISDDLTEIFIGNCISLNKERIEEKIKNMNENKLKRLFVAFEFSQEMGFVFYNIVTRQVQITHEKINPYNQIYLERFGEINKFDGYIVFLTHIMSGLKIPFFIIGTIDKEKSIRILENGDYFYTDLLASLVNGTNFSLDFENETEIEVGIYEIPLSELELKRNNRIVKNNFIHIF